MFAGSDALPGYRERAIARTPLGRIGTPDDIAAAVLALLRLDWVTGHVLVADGGLSLYSPVDPMESLE
jgi:NAD(P)-dependent dehydrogenase (short-subunit alcohol dehydrogenase family)